MLILKLETYVCNINSYYAFQIAYCAFKQCTLLYPIELAGFIIGITRKFCKPLIERTKCNFTAPPCWPLNMLKILPDYP